MASERSGAFITHTMINVPVVLPERLDKLPRVSKKHPAQLFQVILNSHNSLTPNHRLPARNIMRWKNEIFRADSVKCHAHRADKFQQK